MNNYYLSTSNLNILILIQIHTVILYNISVCKHDRIFITVLKYLSVMSFTMHVHCIIFTGILSLNSLFLF